LTKKGRLFLKKIVFIKGGETLKKLFLARSEPLDLSTQRVLYNQFYKIVYRTAYKYCGDPSMASDIVQESFIRAFKYISTYKEEVNGSFEGWLVTITKNEAIKQLQQRWKRNEIYLEEINNHIMDIPDPIDTIEEQVVEKMNTAEINDAINDLPLHYRQIILLRLFHGYSYKEIGSLLDLTENAARQLYHRAKREVKIRLQEKWSATDEE